MINKAGLRRHPLDRRRALARLLRRDAGPAARRARATSSSGSARPASESGNRRKWGWSSRPQNNAHPALHVDDVAAAKAELEAKGVEFKGDVFDTGVCHMALFTDPDGNDLMLHHRYAPYE